MLDAYGFSAKKDLLAQLLDLNLEVADRIEQGHPVTAPGVPPAYGDPAALVTEDCIRPARASGGLVYRLREVVTECPSA